MAVKMRPARMSSAEYWRRRESQRRKERIADEKERAKLLQEIYRSAVDQMTREVESFFQRYARDEQITLADARRRVSLLDMKEYERLAKQYVESKDFSPEANRQMKLYNLTMKANRLELLRNRLGLEMVKMTNETQTEISRSLVERSLETFEEYAGILGESVRDPLALAAAISQEPFKGARWSERLWGTNQKGLYDSVTKTLENALISGKNARQLASSLRKQYGRSLYEAERLMVTEMARCQTEAAKLSMEINGNEYYMVLTANAMGPCGDCSDLEDQTTRDPIPVKDMEPGVNAPPLHPSCHCATAPWWDEKKYQEWLDSGAAGAGLNYTEYQRESESDLAGHGPSGFVKSWSNKIHDILTDKSPMNLYELDSKYRNELIEVAMNSPKEIRKLINNHINDIKFINLSALEPGSSAIGIRTNLDEDSINPFGKWSITFHEVGHQIDMLNNYASHNRVFRSALLEDFAAVVKEYKSRYNYTKKEAYEKLSGELINNRMFVMSDLFGGMTRNKCVGIFSHEDDYWDDPHGLESEAFAHFFDITARNDRETIMLVEVYFPNAYKLFKNLLRVYK